jgi:hypothetical protein
MGLLWLCSIPRSRVRPIPPPHSLIPLLQIGLVMVLVGVVGVLVLVHCRSSHFLCLMETILDWIRRVEDYFDLYGVEPYRWIKLATMNFSPTAARLFPSVEKRLQSCSWDEFRTLLLDRFGREHHELLVRQLLSIKQTDLMSEYVGRFAVLVDQLSAYNNQSDPLYYIIRFIDGLREDLRPPILIQRPTSLDTAFVLTQLQEEVSSSTRHKEFRKQDFSFKTATPWALPPPPTHSNKPSNLYAEDCHATEATHAKLSTENRLAALRASRHARASASIVQRSGHGGISVKTRFNCMHCKGYLKYFSPLRLLMNLRLTVNMVINYLMCLLLLLLGCLLLEPCVCRELFRTSLSEYWWTRAVPILLSVLQWHPMQGASSLPTLVKVEVQRVMY